MKSKLNTNSGSTERIWVYNRIDQLNFQPGNAPQFNSIEATIDFLTLCNTKVKLEEYKEVSVQPASFQSDPDESEEYYISVWGYKLESLKAYRLRLESMLWNMDRNKEIFYERKKYYDLGGDNERKVIITAELAKLKQEECQ